MISLVIASLAGSVKLSSLYIKSVSGKFVLATVAASHKSSIDKCLDHPDLILSGTTPLASLVCSISPLYLYGVSPSSGNLFGNSLKISILLTVSLYPLCPIYFVVSSIYFINLSFTIPLFSEFSSNSYKSSGQAS